MLAQLILSRQIKKVREVYLPIENEKSSEVPQHEGATNKSSTIPCEIKESEGK